MAAESEALAGQNLKTAIALAHGAGRGARGAWVRNGRHRARTEAVEIAARTDLVLDHADACAELAKLLERVGDEVGKSRPARGEAVRLYEAKGAVVPAQRLVVDGQVPSAAVEQSSVAAAFGNSPSSRLGETESDPGPDAGHRNAAHRVADQMAALINAGDVERLAEAFARGFVNDDRRLTVSWGVHGIVDLLDGIRASIDLGLTLNLDAEPIAVRGERLAVGRSRWNTGSGDEIVQLTLVELDEDGRIATLVSFEASDTDAALAELEVRFARGEGKSYPVHLRLASELTRCQQA